MTSMLLYDLNFISSYAILLSGGNKMARSVQDIHERFWKHVARTENIDECWPWTASRHKQGYGWFGVRDEETGKYKLHLTHRVVWFLAYGEWPTLDVLHRCDNPPCCNYYHLFQGTHDDNMKDMAQKKRKQWSGILPPTYHGAEHPNSVLTSELLNAIQERLVAKHSQMSIAAELGISQSMVSQVKRGVTWIQRL